MNTTITMVDYGAGNVGSVMNMLKKTGIPARRGETAADLAQAERLLLPGVGAFDHCMTLLDASGLRSELEKAVQVKKIPTLGICVGFQMMFSGSEEGEKPGLNWLAGDVARFDAARLLPQQKIPHMGWNNVHPVSAHPLFAGMQTPRFYFVHSYHARPKSTADVIATTQYGYDFCCAAQHGNLIGVQFHPEKSHRFGMQLLRNFSAWQLAVAA